MTLYLRSLLHRANIDRVVQDRANSRDFFYLKRFSRARNWITKNRVNLKSSSRSQEIVHTVMILYLRSSSFYNDTRHTRWYNVHAFEVSRLPFVRQNASNAKARSFEQLSTIVSSRTGQLCSLEISRGLSILRRGYQIGPILRVLLQDGASAIREIRNFMSSMVI